MTALLFFLASNVWASPVTPQRAALVAHHFWDANNFDKWDGMTDISQTIGIGELYVFANPQGGFVIVSADDCVLPILGYSATAPMEAPLPENTYNWLQEYAWQIGQRKAHGVEATPQVRNTWIALERGTSIEPINTPVTPLLTTTWSQGTYYNNLCPTNASGQHAATGCVATAMAQVMKYWNFPSSGRGNNSYTHPTFGVQSANFGTTTYDWTHMPNALYSTSTAQEVQAVATLMYHAGVSITTNYGMSSQGSSAEVIAINGVNYPCVENALRQYFDYSPEIFGARLSGIDESIWKQLLRNDLDSARPVVYTGFDFSGGHCFVCDGYNSQDMFHFNWGWGGMSDGYFAIGNLNPGVGGIGTNSSSSFCLDNMAVFGIRPAVRTNPSTAMVSATVSGTGQGSVSGSGNYNNFTDLVTLSVTANPSYRFDHWSDGDRNQPRKFWANGNVNLTAHMRPVVGDTIAYCGNAYESNIDIRYFGMKVETADIPANQSLRSVMLYNDKEGDFTIRIYAGDNYSPGTVAYQETFHLEGKDRWETLRFSQNVPISNTQPLWIIAYCPNASFAAPLTSYCGNSNGSWQSPNGQVWSNTLDLTYMIKAIFAQSSDVTIVASALDPTQGSVTGGGNYALGESCTLTAIPYGDNVFDHWSDGSTDNPRTVTANANTTYTAIFSGCGISNFPSTQDFSQGLGCWTTYSANQENAEDLTVYSQSSWWGSTDFLVFSSQRTATDYSQYLISPRLVPNLPIEMVFSYKSYSSTTELFEVRYSSTDNSPSSFTHLLRTGASTNSTWDTMQVTIPAEAHYVTIKYVTQHGYNLHIDDIILNSQPLPEHTITVLSETEGMGSVTGGGTFQEGTSTAIEAIPTHCHMFTHWQDGNTQNPRTIVVSGNATYTASFASTISYGTETLNACDSVEWFGEWYYESTASANHNSMSADGCDSVTTLILTLNHSSTTDTTIVAEDEYVIDGTRYTESQDVMLQYQTIDGCDSVVTIHLTIQSHNVPIDEVDGAAPKIWVSGHNIIVEGTKHRGVIITNILGQIMTQVENAPDNWRSPKMLPGIYLVRVGTANVKKMIVR